MASLRDKLVEAGLASKKDARKVNRELKRKRKRAQGRAEKKKAAQARRRERQRRERAAREEAMIEESLARKREARQQARKQQVDQILRQHAIRFGAGRIRFWHRKPGQKAIGRLDIPERLARDLVAGRAGIGLVLGSLGQPDYVVVPSEVIGRVRGILPERVVFFNDPPADPDAPLHAPLDPALWSDGPTWSLFQAPGGRANHDPPLTRDGPEAPRE